jgi:hypothetical protein
MVSAPETVVKTLLASVTPAALAMVRSLKVVALVPSINCAEVPLHVIVLPVPVNVPLLEKLPPILWLAVPATKVPLFIKSPVILNPDSPLFLNEPALSILPLTTIEAPE